MNGKIFKESANIYQDQARVLFEYYRKAAEQIVNEEMRIESQIAGAQTELHETETELRGIKPREIAGYAAAGISLLLYFVIDWFAVIPALGAAAFAVITHLKGIKLKQKTAEIESAIAGFQTAHQQIPRDYRVSKLGLAYVPVARQIPFEGKSILIDLTDSTPKQEFRLSWVRKRELLASAISELEDLLREVPMVEASSEPEEVRTDQFSRSIQKVALLDYVGAMDRKLRTAAFCLQDLENAGVELPAIAPQSEAANYLAVHSTDDPAGFPVFSPFPAGRFDKELETFRSLNDTKKSMEQDSAQFEEVLRNLMLNTARAVQTVSRLKVASTSRLVEESNRLMFTILKASYNHYSPKLEAEEIERIRMESFDYQDSVDSYRPFQLKKSSRVLYDPVSDSWIAEDGSRTRMPFGLNQIEEEIVAPIVQNLMAETRLERLKIYNNIKDQKINYLNKWHRDTEDFYGRNRAEASDITNLMRSALSDFISNYTALSALEKTNQNMSGSGSLEATVTSSDTDQAEVAVTYAAKSQEFQSAQEEFAEYMDRLKEDIERRSAKYGFIEYYDASLRDGAAKSIAEAVGKAHTLEDRRKPLLAVNPYFAAVSELPPAPSVEAEAYDNLSLNLEAMALGALAELAPASQSNGKPSGDGAHPKTPEPLATAVHG